MIKRQKLAVPSSEDGDYESRMRDYDDQSEVEGGEDSRYLVQGNANVYHEEEEEEDGDGYAGGRLSRKRTDSVSSPLTVMSWKDSSPPPMTAQAPVTTPSASHAPSATGGRARKMSLKAKQMAGIRTPIPPTTTTKRSSSKGKQKTRPPSTSSNKRKLRKEDESEEEEEYNDDDDEDVDEDEDEDEEDEEARFSDDNGDYEEDEPPARGKKGRGGGGGERGSKARGKEKEKDMTPIPKKAKFEGNSAAAGSTATATKRSRVKKTVGEDSVVDIMEDSGTPEPSSIGSPATTAATDGAKADIPTNSAPVAKKRKLPTIKKLKSTTSLGGGAGGSGTVTGPSTPSSGVGNKPPPLPPAGAVAGSGASKSGIADARMRTIAATDLDLSNPSLYAELFKNVSS